MPNPPNGKEIVFPGDIVDVSYWDPGQGWNEEPTPARVASDRDIYLSKLNPPYPEFSGDTNEWLYAWRGSKLIGYPWDGFEKRGYHRYFLGRGKPIYPGQQLKLFEEET